MIFYNTICAAKELHSIELDVGHHKKKRIILSCKWITFTIKSLNLYIYNEYVRLANTTKHNAGAQWHFKMKKGTYSMPNRGDCSLIINDPIKCTFCYFRAEESRR